MHPPAVKCTDPWGHPHQESSHLSTAALGHMEECHRARYAMCPQELNMLLTRQSPVGTAGCQWRGVSKHRSHRVVGLVMLLSAQPDTFAVCMATPGLPLDRCCVNKPSSAEAQIPALFLPLLACDLFTFLNFISLFITLFPVSSSHLPM